MTPDLPDDIALTSRNGWPDDLRFLIERYPREVWQGHGNLGEMARFWLARHDMFRQIGGALDDATTRMREGAVTPATFQTWFAPRLQFFLGELETHHQIEDYHYFPLFRAAEQRLDRGFAVLEADHALIHGLMVTSVDTANGLLRVLDSDADTVRRATDAYADAGTVLLKGLIRHLDDEEDLIVPLILDRGEETIGVGH